MATVSPVGSHCPSGGMRKRVTGKASDSSSSVTWSAARASSAAITGSSRLALVRWGTATVIGPTPKRPTLCRRGAQPDLADATLRQAQLGSDLGVAEALLLPRPVDGRSTEAGQLLRPLLVEGEQARGAPALLQGIALLSDRFEVVVHIRHGFGV